MILENKKNFCVLPFIHLSTGTNGRVKLCCRADDSIGNIKENSLKDLWNSSVMKEIRKKMLNDERIDMCQVCWELEDVGVTSLRQTKNAQFKQLFSLYIDSLRSDFSMPFNIPVIELKLSNLCNLRCRMCHPGNSTSWLKDWDVVHDLYKATEMSYFGEPDHRKKMNYFNKDTFFQNIKQLGPYLKILEFAGGEPLMDPLHWRVIEAISPWSKNIQLKYSTNLSILEMGRFNVLKEWSKFKSLDLSVSVDGYPELNNYIRTDLKTEDLVDNVKKVKNEIDSLTIRAALCLSVYNVLRLPECYDWITGTLELPVHGNYVKHPSFLNVRILPPEVKQSLSEKFNRYVREVQKGKYSMYPKKWSKRIVRYTVNTLKYMDSEGLQERWPAFVDYTKRLDKSRNTNILKVLDELTPYF